MNISGKPSVLAVHIPPAAVALGPGVGLPPDFAPHDMTGPNTPAPFQVVASSQFDSSSFGAYNASSKNVNSSFYWIGTGGAVELLRVDIGAGKAIILGRYDLQMNTIPEPARAPKNWTMQASLDASTWVTIDTQTNQSSWGNGEQRAFIPAVQTTPYRFFQLSITANNGDATYTQVAEIYLYYQIPAGQTQFAPHTMTANTTGAYTASASTADIFGEAYRAFDGSIRSNNCWRGANAGVDWLKIDIGVGASWLLDSYAVQMSTTASLGQAPKAWTMEGSNDNSTWVVLDTVTNQTGWDFYEARTYICDVKPAYYRYFRINITANNGDATYTQVGELFLYGTV